VWRPTRARVREERSEVDRHASMSDSSRSQAPTRRLPDQARRMLPAAGAQRGGLAAWGGGARAGAGDLEDVVGSELQAVQQGSLRLKMTQNTGPTRQGGVRDNWGQNCLFHDLERQNIK
jgi:hypothetical protein